MLTSLEENSCLCVSKIGKSSFAGSLIQTINLYSYNRIGLDRTSEPANGRSAKKMQKSALNALHVSSHADLRKTEKSISLEINSLSAKIMPLTPSFPRSFDSTATVARLAVRSGQLWNRIWNILKYPKNSSEIPNHCMDKTDYYHQSLKARNVHDNKTTCHDWLGLRSITATPHPGVTRMVRAEPKSGVLRKASDSAGSISKRFNETTWSPFSLKAKDFKTFKENAGWKWTYDLMNNVAPELGRIYSLLVEGGLFFHAFSRPSAQNIRFMGHSASPLDLVRLSSQTHCLFRCFLSILCCNSTALGLTCRHFRCSFSEGCRV